MTTQSKRCPGCNTEKPITDFGVDSYHVDGFKSHCKLCRSAYQLKKKDHIRDYRRQWNQSDKGRMSSKKTFDKYKEKNKIKIAARKLVQKAVLAGKMSRGPCEICGIMNDTEAHHNNYLNPY